MFTGIIEKMGRLVSLDRRQREGRFTVAHEPWEDPLRPGESVAVQGVCLSVLEAAPEEFACNVLEETLRRTTLGRLKAGAALNLERSLRQGDRIGGHLVYGHVDGVGVVRRAGRLAMDRVIELECAEDVMANVVSKGSIACDGVSLTLAATGATWFRVHIVPLTWEKTSLQWLRRGDPVNVETDMIARCVRAFLSRTVGGGGVDAEALRRAGLV